VHVVATAGHVDHGKSTLVKALTGSEPDRLAEEHRRGLSIELGYCWTRLEAAGDVAFVDVPGHERFLPTMLSGVGPVPAVLFVVAADDPWMPQAAEHLAALDALDVRHGVVAITRCDLADPTDARERAAAELSTTTLRGAPVVTVSGRTGQGLDELRARLVEMVKRLPPADPTADVRLWVDRRFTIKGAGTVVTGTLPAGRVCVDDVLHFGDRRVRVRGVQALDQPVPCAAGVSRVALNLVGGELSALERGSVLVTPDAWHFTEVVDVRVAPSRSARSGRAMAPPRSPMLHIGAASVALACRPLGDDISRLRLQRPLPLRIGDRALLRDPGSRRLWGVTVLDPAPPELTRRGAAAARAGQLATAPSPPQLAAEVERRGLVHVSLLRQIGALTSARADNVIETGGWLISSARAASASADIERMVHEHRRQFPLEPGPPVLALADSLGLPSADLVRTLVQPPLKIIDGRVTESGTSTLPAQLERAIEALGVDLHDSPFAAPTADRLAELGLDTKAVAAAAKAARVLRLADGIVLMPGAEHQAARRLAELPQPFTASEARAHLATSRRVVLPLLEYLDKSRITRRLPDDRRVLL
jgi:selenocysteine-specific elongation factor